MNSVYIRLKGLLLGAIFASMGTFLSLQFTLSTFLEDIFGESLLVNIIRIIISGALLIVIISPIIIGLIQFFTGKDRFMSMAFDDETNNEKSENNKS